MVTRANTCNFTNGMAAEDTAATPRDLRYSDVTLSGPGVQLFPIRCSFPIHRVKRPADGSDVCMQLVVRDAPWITTADMELTVLDHTITQTAPGIFEIRVPQQSKMTVEVFYSLYFQDVSLYKLWFTRG